VNFTSLAAAPRRLSRRSGKCVTRACAEALEQRRLLTAPPTVTGWRYDFEHLPHKIELTFSADVSASLQPADLRVDQVTTTDPDPVPTSLSYDAATNTATFAFAGVLPDGNYRFALDSEDVRTAGTDPQNLDADFFKDFSFLLADIAKVDPTTGASPGQDGRVTLDDYNRMAQHFGAGTTYGQGDFNYDGAVNLQDYNIVVARFGNALAPRVSGPDSVSVSVLEGTNTANLNWQDSAPADATGYRIQRSTDGQTFAFLKNLARPDIQYSDPNVAPKIIGWEDTTVATGQRYWYRVRAYKLDESGNEVWGTAYTPKSAATTKMPAPSNVTAMNLNSTQARVTWTDNSANEIGFDIEVSDGTATWVVSDVPANSTSAATATVSGLTPARAYTFKVRAGGSSTDSAWSPASNSVTTDAAPTGPIAAPSDLSAVMIAPGRIELNWRDNSHNEGAFRVERKYEGTAGWVQVTQLGFNFTSWTNNGVAFPEGIQGVHYRVRGFGAAGLSEYSAVASVYVPANLTATATDYNRVTVKWSYPSGPGQRFVVEQLVDGHLTRAPFDEPRSNEWEVVGQASDTQLTLDDVADGQGYDYRVTAYYGDGGGGATYNTAHVVTPVRKPSGLTVYGVNDLGDLWLRWTDESVGNDGYEIKFKDVETGSVDTWATTTLNRTRFSGTPGRTYEFEVRAYAVSRNVMTYSDPVRVTRALPTAPNPAPWPPVQRVSLSGAAITEDGSQPTRVTVSREYVPEPPAPLTVQLSAPEGTAVQGEDYAAFPTSVTIPATETSTSFTIQPINDQRVEVEESIAFWIEPSSAYRAWNGAQIRVIDDEPNVSVQWEAIDSPLSSNPGTGHAMSAVGQRIFPDYLSYEDTVDRRRVRVKATTSPAKAGVPIHFKLIDVDNPSYHVAAVDDEANELDNIGSASLSSDYAYTDSNGVSSVELITSWNPLDNYIVIASTDQDYLASLRNIDGNGDGLRAYQYIGNQRGPTPATTQATQPAQVGRRMHVEIDSMGAPGAVQYEPGDQPSGDVADPEIASFFRDAYKAAGVEVVQLEEESSSDLPFYTKFTGTDQLTAKQVMEDYLVGPDGHRQSRSKGGYVTVYIAGVYELGGGIRDNFANDSKDNDENTEFGEVGLTGRSQRHGRWWSLVFLEVLRDLQKDEHHWSDMDRSELLRLATMHELTHVWYGVDHPPGDFPIDVMWVPSTDDRLLEIKPVLSAETIDKINRLFGEPFYLP
jgi:hypothetical protein